MGKPASPRKVGDKEALAVGNTIRGSAQKLNLVARPDPRPQGRATRSTSSSSRPRAMADDVRKVLASARRQCREQP